MIGLEPNFVSSPFFVCEPDNWHLKPGAPENVKKEFEEFMRSHTPGKHRTLPAQKIKDK